MTTAMYFVSFSDQNGENYDLFVEAKNPDQAIVEWLKYYCYATHLLRPKYVFVVPPMLGRVGYKRWHEAVWIVWPEDDTKSVTIRNPRP
jgi:hypothetical protein